MVVLVGHALLLRGIRLDIDDVTNAEVGEVGGQLDGAVFYEHRLRSEEILNARSKFRTLEAPLEHVARTRAVTEGVRHLEGV